MSPYEIRTIFLYLISIRDALKGVNGQIKSTYHTKEHMGLTTWADVPDDKMLCYLLERQLQEISTNISVKFEIEVWYNRESLGPDLKKGEEL